MTRLPSFGTGFVSILFTWLQFTEFGDSLSHNLAFLYDILIHSCRICLKSYDFLDRLIVLSLFTNTTNRKLSITRLFS